MHATPGVGVKLPDMDLDTPQMHLFHALQTVHLDHYIRTVSLSFFFIMLNIHNMLI